MYNDHMKTAKHNDKHDKLVQAGSVSYLKIPIRQRQRSLKILIVLFFLTPGSIMNKTKHTHTHTREARHSCVARTRQETHTDTHTDTYRRGGGGRGSLRDFGIRNLRDVQQSRAISMTDMKKCTTQTFLMHHSNSFEFFGRNFFSRKSLNLGC